MSSEQMFATFSKLIAIGAVTAFVAGKFSHDPFDMIVGNQWMFWFFVISACVTVPTHFPKALTANRQTALNYLVFGFSPMLFVFAVGFASPLLLTSFMGSDTIYTATIMLAESSGIARVAFLSIVWLMMGISLLIAGRGVWLTFRSGQHGSSI